MLKFDHSIVPALLIGSNANCYLLFFQNIEDRQIGQLKAEVAWSLNQKRKAKTTP